ncbi:hypothetical protein [Singulisphaera acidiphila]|uniref:Uncharacterized protein n=1 Tax=Singulisphaera acidiphila (strain ATCC BAA-1392 / DSM 18658 / VKM B-2454 / MOB10) TaxID=886293 RepID=L0DAQ8_SINAD|nr:hypothetical protein [Singulisphaera acidiphila]AGA26337.1 hypothetical protein Sinac_1984 [Singulisphaera acidiphila DSM 18658]
MTGTLRGMIVRQVIEHLINVTFALIIGDGDFVATAVGTTPTLLEIDTTISLGLGSKRPDAGWHGDHIELLLRGSTRQRKLL